MRSAKKRLRNRCRGIASGGADILSDLRRKAPDNERVLLEAISELARCLCGGYRRLIEIQHANRGQVSYPTNLALVARHDEAVRTLAFIQSSSVTPICYERRSISSLRVDLE